MAWSISSLFPTWGDTGEQPPTSFEYQGGDQVNEKHLDYLWDSVGTLEDETRSALTDIDSDSDGIVDEADAAQSASTAFDLSGNALTDSTQVFLDLTGNDVRVGTGRSIEDGSGENRINIGSSTTKLNDANGKTQFASSTFFARINAYSDQQVEIFDQEGEFRAVRYNTDLNTGTLSLPNANLSVEENELQNIGIAKYTNSYNSGDSFALSSGGTSSNPTFRLYWIDDSAGTSDRPIDIDYGSNLFDISDHPQDFRLATGKAIEDGSGQRRMSLGSDRTQIFNDSGDRVFEALSGVRTTIRAYGQPIVLRDQDGGFNAVQYTSDPSIGTLELTNAVMTISGQEASTNIGPQRALEIDTNDDNSAQSSQLEFTNGNGAGVGLYNNSGELVGEDDVGNITTLT